ncbi:MAG: hypothetical protein JNM84_26465 [Planctomycetes bacterium]|nr:hypothetical protein [Planctomycetota bacterium]
MVLPAAQKHQSVVAQSVAAVKAAGLAVPAQEKRLRSMTERIEHLLTAIDDLAHAFEKTEAHHGAVRDHALAFRHDVVPGVARLRESCDILETMVDDSLWPLPKYRELLFFSSSRSGSRRPQPTLRSRHRTLGAPAGRRYTPRRAVASPR